MSRPLVFMMGRSPAILPTDRQYARNHMWAMATEGECRFGLSAYAVRLLGDVQHLRWSIKVGDSVSKGQEIGYVEASKATSDLYSPMAGRVCAINAQVPGTPRLLNSNLYDTGWLLALAGDSPPLLSPEEYLAHLETVWPLAQRLLKGQVGHPPAG